MKYNIRFVSTYPRRFCGIATFAKDLATALWSFTGEVGSVRVAAIDKEGLDYDIPVDIRINQPNPESWKIAARTIANRATETRDLGPTVVLFQHEYGLDGEGTEKNYVEMAKILKGSNGGLIALAQLHTVLRNPDEHQRKTLQELAENCDGLVVPATNAIEILSSEKYGIPRTKITHIDHGIRMRDPAKFDRQRIKAELDLEDIFLVTTPGLKSPNKGLVFGIQGYGRFLRDSCTPKQRKRIVYLIAGRCHPEFMAAQEGRPYKEFEKEIKSAVSKSKLKSTKIEARDLGDLRGVDFKENDVVFLEQFLDEEDLLKLYGASNLIVLPYLNLEQISSGILADTVGSGRVAISTKFMYALELLAPKKPEQTGVLGIKDPDARGILIDSEEQSIAQIAQSLDYLIIDEGGQEIRLEIERRARRRGRQMRWDNVAYDLIQHIDGIREERSNPQGRGPIFERKKTKPFFG